jgi:uncharacterized membrane protein YsdA (DUF1294 family)
MLGLLLYTYLFIINVIAFGLYGLDKHKAYYGKWRIPEAVLLGVAVIGGAYGALMGMWLFRHKTLHQSFRTTVPVSFVVWLLILVAICLYHSPQQIL